MMGSRAVDEPCRNISYAGMVEFGVLYILKDAKKFVSDVVAKMEACQKDVEAKRAMMAEGDAETLKKLKKSMAKAKEAEVELASQIDDKAKALKEAHKAAQGWRAKLDSLVASSAQVLCALSAQVLQLTAPAVYRAWVCSVIRSLIHSSIHSCHS